MVSSGVTVSVLAALLGLCVVSPAKLTATAYEPAASFGVTAQEAWPLLSLVPVQVGARTVMHEPRYEMRLSAAAQLPAVAEATGELHADDLERLLTFTPSDSGETLRNLPIVHEHPMHVTVVSRDLSFFDHVHPIPQDDGSLQLQYRFPRYGDYVVFAEFTPSGQRFGADQRARLAFQHVEIMFEIEHLLMAFVAAFVTSD